MPTGIAMSLQFRTPHESVTIGSMTDMTSNTPAAATRTSVKRIDSVMSRPRFLIVMFAF
jgi:hypothetical protein